MFFFSEMASTDPKIDSSRVPFRRAEENRKELLDPKKMFNRLIPSAEKKKNDVRQLAAKKVQISVISLQFSFMKPESCLAPGHLQADN